MSEKNMGFAENSDVIVQSAPITERYWYKGCIGTIRNNQIRVCGAWFTFDDRWEVTEQKN